MPVSIELSDAAYAVVCGLVQPSEEIEVNGITASERVWEELRLAFPSHVFHANVAKGRVGYEFGWGT
jgi:hypothetical protein